MSETSIEKTSTEKTSTSGMSPEEMIDSLTGFDEIAIGKHFDLNVYTDGEREPIMILRALTFVHLRREGKTDPEARQAVLEMRLADVQNYFDDDEDEVDAEEPATEVGKGDSPDA